LQNRFVPFRFAISFYKILGFPLEATFRSDRLNQHQSAICAPLYKKEVVQAPTAWSTI